MSNSLVCLCWNIHLDSALPHSYPAAGFHLLLFSPHSLKTSSASPTIPYLNCHQAGTDGYFGLFSLSPVQFQQAELPGVFPRWMGNPSPPAAPQTWECPGGGTKTHCKCFYISIYLSIKSFIGRVAGRTGLGGYLGTGGTEGGYREGKSLPEERRPQGELRAPSRA